MEWQNEQVRFFSNSGVFGVGFISRDKGGVLMNLLLSVTLAFIVGFVGGCITVVSSQDKALQRGLVYSDKKVYVCKPLDLSEVKP